MSEEKQEVSIKFFEKFDIRIGTVVEAVVPDWSHWVMRLTVDFGPQVGKRVIFSGIMKFYQPQQVIGKQYPFVVNLKPKRIGPPNSQGEYEYSHGMMLMSVGALDVSDDDEDTAPVLLQPAKKVPDGAVVR